MARRGRGEGSIERLPSGKYRARKAKFVAGSILRSSKTFTRRDDAVRWLNEQTGPAAAGTLGEWLDSWLELQKPNIAAKSYDHDESRVRRHLKPRLGSVRLRDLSTLAISKMLAAMATDEVSDSERYKAGCVLRAAL